MHIWRRTNLVLAIIVLILSVGALLRFGFTYWSDHHIKPQQTVSGPVTQQQSQANSKLRISDFHYYYAVDFLKRPTLIVKYTMANSGGDAALPQYVFDTTVMFEQQTNSGTTSVLAATNVAKGQLSFLMQNYQENGSIVLNAKQKATIVTAYRLESRNRPVLLMVKNAQKGNIKPWTLEAAKVEE